MNLTPSLFEVSSKRKAMVKKKTPSKRLQKQADIQKATKKLIAEKVEELAIKKNELYGIVWERVVSIDPSAPRQHVEFVLRKIYWLNLHPLNKKLKKTLILRA